MLLLAMLLSRVTIASMMVSTPASAHAARLRLTRLHVLLLAAVAHARATMLARFGASTPCLHLEIEGQVVPQLAKCILRYAANVVVTTTGKVVDSLSLSLCSGTGNGKYASLETLFRDGSKSAAARPGFLQCMGSERIRPWPSAASNGKRDFGKETVNTGGYIVKK